MSFGDELSREFYRLSGRIFNTEEVLFTKLEDAFINLSVKYSGYKTEIIHGARSMVKFEYTGSCVSSVAWGSTVERELSDLMFIVFSKKKCQIRLCYMQNKRADSGFVSNHRFHADLLQLYLLKERRMLLGPILPACVFGDRGILHNACLPSVGSYGVFYKDDVNQRIEMAYFPAQHLTPVSRTGKSVRRLVEYNSSMYGVVACGKPCEEHQGTKTLRDFGDALIDMQIGTPICQKSEAYDKLISFLLKHSRGFIESGFLSDVGNMTEFMSDDNNEPEGYPTVVVINADAKA